MRINNQSQTTLYNNYSILNAAKRINSAADDAAGLSIASKLKSNVDGLNQAARNVQDGISLLKTAEGATSQVQDSLNRMRELAVQSANGINSAEDRQKLSLEFDQLKQEINDITSQSKFNNIPLLDGSLSNTGGVRTAETAGISVNVTEQPGPAAMMSSISVDPSTATEGAAAQFSLDLGSFAISGASAGDSFDLSIGGANLSAVLDAGSYSASDLAGEIAAAYENQSIEIGGSNYTVAADEGLLTFTYDNGGMAENNIDIAAGEMESFEVAASYVPADGSSGSQEGALAGITAQAGRSYSEGSVSNNIVFNSRLKVGDVFQMAGKKVELVIPGAGRRSSEALSTVSITEAMSNREIAQAMREAIAAQHGERVNVQATDNGIRIEQKTPGQGDVAAMMRASSQKNSTVDFDMSKLRAGDQIKLTLSDSGGNKMTTTYTHNQGNTSTDLARALTQGTSGTRSGNTLRFEGQEASVEFTPATQDTGGMRVQSGAAEGQQKGFSIDNMNTASLGLDDVSISTQDGASQALSALDSAISQVSEQRGTLGAMENRFKATAGSIGVSAENQLAAQSRIEDADMAMEMMRIMQQNIMAQSSQAVMAQGMRMDQQNVMSLLGR